MKHIHWNCICFLLFAFMPVRIFSSGISDYEIEIQSNPAVTPPTIQGSLGILRVQELTGNVSVQTASTFIGEGLTYSLSTTLEGVTINSTNGVVMINTNIVGRRKESIISILASNSVGSVNQNLKLTVGPQLGVSMPYDYLRYKSENQLSALYNSMFEKNIVFMRCDLHWKGVEGTKGTYIWDSPQTSNNYARIARLAEASGLKVIWILHVSPTWAKLSGVNGGGPATAADFGKFAGEAARYFTSNGFNVRHWEIWNEPNLPSFWDTNFLKTSTQLNSSAIYLAEMHIAAYNAIKSIDPSSTVITGGLSSVPATVRNSSNSKVYVNPTDWLTAMYSVAGFANAVDAIGIHPYVHPLSVAGTQTENGVRMMRQDMRNLLVGKGHGNKKVWITEFGAPTDGTVWNKVSEDTQRNYLRDLFDFEAGTTWGGPLIWYTWFDMGAAGYGGVNESENWFGAFRPENTGYVPKPVAEVIESIKRGVSGESTDISEITELKNIRVYPNPTNGTVHVEMDNLNMPDIKLYNLQGELIMKSLSKKIDLSGYPAGFYLLYANGHRVKVIKK